VLIPGTALAGKVAAPQRRIDLGDRGSPARNVPSVERPEMHAAAQLPANEAKPGNSGMGGFRYRSRHVEMEDGFGAAGADLGQPPPARIAHARRTVAANTLAHEIDVGVIFIGRPMPLEILEEARPVGLKPMRLEIA